MSARSLSGAQAATAATTAEATTTSVVSHLRESALPGSLVGAAETAALLANVARWTATTTARQLEESAVSNMSLAASATCCSLTGRGRRFVHPFWHRHFCANLPFGFWLFGRPPELKSSLQLETLNSNQLAKHSDTCCCHQAALVRSATSSAVTTAN